MLVRQGDEADVPFLGEMLLKAFEGHLRFGPIAAACPNFNKQQRLQLFEAAVRSSLTLPDGRIFCFSWQNSLVCTHNGVRVGALFRWSERTSDITSLFGPVFAAAFEGLGKASEFAFFDSFVSSVFSAHKFVNSAFTGCVESPRFHTEGIATKRKFQRKGVCRLLLTAAFEEAREAGFREAVLCRFKGNLQAKLAYERTGFDEIVSVSCTQGSSAAVVADGFVWMIAKL
jgi:ribosomal protein S18 acetylase RimI-like enzyme